MKRVTVIIPTVYSSDFTRLEQTIRAVESAKKQVRDVKLSIIIACNLAPEGIQENLLKDKLKRLCALPIAVVINYINKGFAPAVNDGILYARATVRPDWYLMLNDDAFLHENFFVRLLPQLRSGRYDAVCCGIQTPGGSIESVGLRYTSFGLAFPRRKPIEPAEPSLFSGTCVLLSGTRVEKELNRYGYVFNPLFFAYAEDLELSLRILDDKGRIYISNESLVTHFGSQTAVRGSYFQLFHGYRNLVLIVVLLWSWKDIIFRFPMLLVGQAYIIAMSLYKGYVLLYPKMWRWIIRNRHSIAYLRHYHYGK